MWKIESFQKQREVLSLPSVTVKIIDQENEQEKRMECLIAKTISESVIVTILANRANANYHKANFTQFHFQYNLDKQYLVKLMKEYLFKKNCKNYKCCPCHSLTVSH